MTRTPLGNKIRVALPDSEPDLDYDSDESIDNATAPASSPTNLGAYTKPGNGHDSDNINDNNPHSASGRSRDDTPSATSSMGDLSHRNATIRSDKDMPSQIGRSKTVKRKAGIEGIDLQNIISPSPRASKESNSLQNGHERPEKRRRLTRGHGQKGVSYDMKHHPMDDILRPKYSAKRRRNWNQVPEDSSGSDGNIDEDDENDTPGRNVHSSHPHRRRSSRNIHQNETPIYSAKWHPLDQMLKDNTSKMRDSKKDDRSKHTRRDFIKSLSALKDDEDPMTVDSTPDPDEDVDRETAPISPSQRRSARVSSSKKSPPNYDMKYHIMDSTLRPKATAKRLRSRLQSATSTRTFNNSPSSLTTKTKQVAEASPKPLAKRSVHRESELDVSVAPPRSQLQNPYLDGISLGWTQIQEMDRRIYLLQKGAPPHGDTLPQDWTQDVIKKFLSDEGVNTLDELSCQDNTKILKIRYETVRLSLQKFFDSKPEPVNKMGWTLSESEGFDVYDKKSGSKYWRHQEDSVVRRTKISSSSISTGQTTRTANNMIGIRNQEDPGSILEERHRNEAKMASIMPNGTCQGDGPNKSCSERSPILQLDTDRMTVVDLEDYCEKGVITETEDTLVESMQAEQLPYQVMSDAALEKLLFSAELYLRGTSNDEVMADIAMNDSGGSKPTGLVLTPRLDKILDENKSFTSKATATDLNTPSNQLAGPVQIGHETTTPGTIVGHGGECDEPRTPRRAKKRKSRADPSVAVHEDLPGRTPLVKKIIAMNPASPGTDIPKENFEDDGSVEHSSQLEIRVSRTQRHNEAVGTPTTRGVRRSGNATTAAPRSPAGESLASSPLNSSRTLT